jgi:hypothetical protein
MVLRVLPAVLDRHMMGSEWIVIFREGLKQKMAPGKKVQADRGYNSNLADESVDVVNAQHYGQQGIAKFQVP